MNINDIQKKLSQENLFFSPSILSKTNNIVRNNKKEIEFLFPIYWQNLATGICTNGMNCPSFLENRCSICPYFLTGPFFFQAINSKVMQLSTIAAEYFKIIDKHAFDDNLNENEAEIYVNELQMVLAELQGYWAIIDKINKLIAEYIHVHIPEEEKKNLPLASDLIFIKYEHIPYYAAQIEIYKMAKQNFDHNKYIQSSISELYKKIMELIIQNKLPRELFVDHISNMEKTVSTFIDVMDDKNQNSLQNVIDNFLLSEK